MKTFSRLLILSALAAVHLSGADQPTVIPLWPTGAPGFETRKDEPGQVLNNRQVNIHNPTLALYLPAKSTAPLAAVVIAPGGGYGHLSIDHEGRVVAQWLADHGVAGFALKYRLPRDEAMRGKSPYTVEDHALSDVQRALRLVRAHAAEWGIDPARVGVMGFSAGGELALLATTRPDAGKPDATDAIERQSSRPAFAALMYAIGLTRSDLGFSKDTPPLFLCAGSDDRISEPLPAFYATARKAGVSAELHIYAGVGHGFGIQEKNKPLVANWPDRFLAWLVDRKLVNADAP